jgi:hypothetical protein
LRGGSRCLRSPSSRSRQRKSPRRKLKRNKSIKKNNLYN